MQKIILATLLGLMMTAAAQSPIAIVIHGGAGKIDRKTLPPERERQYLATLKVVLNNMGAIF